MGTGRPSTITWLLKEAAHQRPLLFVAIDYRGGREPALFRALARPVFASMPAYNAAPGAVQIETANIKTTAVCVPSQ